MTLRALPSPTSITPGTCLGGWTRGRRRRRGILCVWILFISIAFILPQANPVDSQTLNYAIVAVGIVLTYSMGFWVISARKWFTGPIKQIKGRSTAICIYAIEADCTVLSYL